MLQLAAFVIPYRTNSPRLTLFPFLLLTVNVLLNTAPPPKPPGHEDDYHDELAAVATGTSPGVLSPVSDWLIDLSYLLHSGRDGLMIRLKRSVRG
jgi:hypothetical protein